MLLVLSPSDQRYRDLLARYHAVCEQVGPLPPPRVVSNDHGYQRFLLFKLPAERVEAPCVTPAMAWLDTPQPGAAAGNPSRCVAGPSRMAWASSVSSC